MAESSEPGATELDALYGRSLLAAAKVRDLAAVLDGGV